MKKTIWFLVMWGVLLLSPFTKCFAVMESNGELLPFGQGIPMLLYHAILNKSDPSQIYAISIDAFKEHLRALKLAGYTTVNTRDLLAHFQRKKNLPKKSILISFDDGERSSYLMSDPILEEMGFQATMFIIPLMQEDQYSLYLSWEELNTMQKSGRWDIQAHGYKYHNLIAIDSAGAEGNFASNLMWLPDKKRLERISEYQERLRSDLIIQKKIIEKNIPGLQVIAFAYPYGDYGESSKNLDSHLTTAINATLVNASFPLSFGTVYFEIDEYTISSGAHLINRFMDSDRLSPDELIRALESFHLQKTSPPPHTSFGSKSAGSKTPRHPLWHS